MKVFLASLLLFAVCNASGVLDSKFLGLQTQIGAKCADTGLGTFKVTSFYVKPWPPTRNTNISMTMTGYATTSTLVDLMYIYVKHNGSEKLLRPVGLGRALNPNQQLTVNYNLLIPNDAAAGNYQVDVKLSNEDENFISCWSVNFTL